MPGADRYRIPAGRHRVEQTINRSRFLCTVDRATTADDAQRLLRELRAEMPDATHHCWAYVAGPPGSTTSIGMSDAGEPHGTAGRPMLTVLLHSDVGEIAAVATRYYGGTKLGTGGLVKAYGGVVQLALADLPCVERVDRVELTITFGYASVTAVQQLLVRFDTEVISEAYEAQVRYRVGVPRPDVAALRTALGDVTRGEAIVAQSGD